MSKKSVAVRIAGHNYKILSEGDGESLREIARYVDAAMDRVRQRTGTVDTLDISVLTCLNLAREILALREQKSGGFDEGRLRELTERVEVALGGEASAMHAEDEAADTASSGRSSSASGPDMPRTLDLPSVEALRDRTGASSGVHAGGSSEDAMPEARVASGGRDRAS